MSNDTAYKGSQAYSQYIPSEESVSPNSGSVSYSKTIICLRGITEAIGLNVQLSYTPGTQGSFGFPQNWSIAIPFTLPGRSLTSQGKTFAVDPDWADVTGWSSGLRYVNHHGMKFERVFPALPLPSGRDGFYGWRLGLTDGAMEYFDEYGKLLEHADLYGNSIYYTYVDPMSGPLSAKVLSILDSWGQTVRFEYNSDAGVNVIAPDGAETKVRFGSQGVVTIEDAVGYTTSFTYLNFAGHILIDQISFPTGLQSQFEYITLTALDKDGESFGLPACATHTHFNTSNATLGVTKYRYGEVTGYSTFTGATIGCRMGDAQDSLMDSLSADYRYDVTVQRFDANAGLLQMSRVYYNYLHLSMTEEHFNVNTNSTLAPTFRNVHTYHIPIDQHSRSTSYSQPVKVEQFHYRPSQSDYSPLRLTESTYDDFGCPLTMVEHAWDPNTNAYVKQKSITRIYTATRWGGELLETEVFADHIAGRERKIAYQLTPDQHNIAGSSVTYRDNTTSSWEPWKTKSYAFDKFGRAKEETVAWSTGVKIPVDSVSQFTYQKSYNFDSVTGIFMESTTDPLGNTENLNYQVRMWGGPLVKKTTPLGATTAFVYDKIGRIIQLVEPLGFQIETSYSVGSGLNAVRTRTPTGYITERFFDELGRCCRLADNGTGGDQAGRILSRMEYDALSRVTKSINELGLVTAESYDPFNRVIQSVDPLGNVTTSKHDDGELTIERRVNGELRTTTFTDTLSRVTKTITHPDSGASDSGYILVSETNYNGFGNVTIRKSFEQASGTGALTLLKQEDMTYDVEDSVPRVRIAGLPNSGHQTMDEVIRQTEFDIFGNPVTYSKTVHYGDGHHYIHKGPLRSFNACNRLVKLTNQLGQVEVNEYDADGRLLTLTRLDGTKFYYKHDLNDRLCSSKGPDGETVQEYFPNGRLAKTIRNTATISHTYSLDGCLQSTEFPDGRKQIYTLDEYSRVIRETNAAGRVTENTFDSLGRLISKQMGSTKIEYQFGTVNHTAGVETGSTVTGSHPHVHTISYDGFGRQARITDRSMKGSIILDTLYTRDSRGRLTTCQLSSEKSSEAEVNNKRSFLYDGLGQLVEDSCYHGQELVPDLSHNFAYDGNYNLIRWRSANEVEMQFSYNDLDQRQDVGFVYDRNGRLTSDPQGRQYTYDSEDRLLSVKSKDGKTYATHAYNPDDSLAKRGGLEGTTIFYYNCGAVNATLDTSQHAEHWTSYLIQPGRRIAAEVDNQGDTSFFESRNSVALSLSKAGVSTHSYQAYGSPNNTSASANNLFGWQQEFTDPDYGLVYLRSRFYSAEHATFLTMDSVSSEDNRYAYCNGDPINFMDGTGHDAQAVGAAIAGAAVGLVLTGLTFGALAPVGVTMTSASLTTTGIAAASVSGAAGTLAGDATTALIQGQSFSVARAAEDLLVGAIGGAIGAGSGGLATVAAESMAHTLKFSVIAIRSIGGATAGVIGGGLGGLASAGATAALHHQSFFSSDTAFAALQGALAGAMGALLGGVLLHKGSKYLPKEITQSDIRKGSVKPFRFPENGEVLNSEALLLIIPEEEPIHVPYMVRTRTLVTDEAPGLMHKAIMCHGEGGRVYVPVEYQGKHYYRPMSAALLADVIEIDQFFRLSSGADGGYSGDLKFISCNGGWYNGQQLANATQHPVWAAKQKVGVEHTSGYSRYS